MSRLSASRMLALPVHDDAASLTVASVSAAEPTFVLVPAGSAAAPAPSPLVGANSPTDSPDAPNAAADAVAASALSGLVRYPAHRVRGDSFHVRTTRIGDEVHVTVVFGCIDTTRQGPMANASMEFIVAPSGTVSARCFQYEGDPPVDVDMATVPARFLSSTKRSGTLAASPFVAHYDQLTRPGFEALQPSHVLHARARRQCAELWNAVWRRLLPFLHSDVLQITSAVSQTLGYYNLLLTTPPALTAARRARSVAGLIGVAMAWPDDLRPDAPLSHLVVALTRYAARLPRFGQYQFALRGIDRQLTYAGLRPTPALESWAARTAWTPAVMPYSATWGGLAAVTQIMRLASRLPADLGMRLRRQPAWMLFHRLLFIGAGELARLVVLDPDAACAAFAEFRRLSGATESASTHTLHFARCLHNAAGVRASSSRPGAPLAMTELWAVALSARRRRLEMDARRASYGPIAICGPTYAMESVSSAEALVALLWESGSWTWNGIQDAPVCVLRRRGDDRALALVSFALRSHGCLIVSLNPDGRRRSTGRLHAAALRLVTRVRAAHGFIEAQHADAPDDDDLPF